VTQQHQAPFQIGDRVRGTSFVPLERRPTEKPELFEGIVVQVGSGYRGVDREHAFVWSRLPDCTERQSLVCETQLRERAAEMEKRR
jgi:hypothetical protein